MIQKLEELKTFHNDDDSIAALNEIENALREKKYGLVWEEHSEAVDDMLRDSIPILIEDPERRLCKDESLPWNFVIEGDNLQALYLLEKTHRGRVDCIYIDPPYNTGARDWKYNNDYVDGNDVYRHSKWLSMMKSRLMVAKRLLNPRDSVLICTIDEKEYLHLGCLLEELFTGARIQMVSSVINPQSAARFGEFSRTDEYLFFVKLGECKPCKLPLSKEWKAADVDAKENGEWSTLRRRGSNSTRVHSPGCFYPIFVDKETRKIVNIGEPLKPTEKRENVIAPEGQYVVFPMKPNNVEGVWQLGREELESRIKGGYVRIGTNNEYGPVINYLSSGAIEKINDGTYSIVGHNADGSVIIKLAVENVPFIPGTQWRIRSHNASQYGSIYLQNILNDKRFTYPKSLYAVHDTIRFFTADKPNATIVDFFAGSGTTMHAINLLNAEDGGNRTCILVTNNEVSEAEQKDFESRGIRKGDKEWESRGIARYVTWPRVTCCIEGHDLNGNPLKGNYVGSDIPMSDGFQANVKYFKCDWTLRKPDDYLLSNALCLHVKELIELQTAQEVDGVRNVIVLSKSDYKRIFDNPDLEAVVERVWVNENLIFNAAEMRKLKAKKYRYIPREFFSQELKEVGEYV